VNSESGIARLIRPRSVAVVGASERDGSLGGHVIRNLEYAGYAGQQYCVNPKYEAVFGVPCYPSIRDLPAAVDCVVVAVPAQYVVPVMKEAADNGVRSAVIFAAGFAESGDEGRLLQSQLGAIARSSGMAICGPNCLGIANFRDGFMGFSSLMDFDLAAGKIAAVCQSGSVALALLNNNRGIRYRYVVSSGNEAATTIEDYIDFFVQDPGTGAILAFVEGLRNVPKLKRAAAMAIEQDKPIIFLKVGRSAVGRRSVVAHTGALAGSEAVHAAFFKQMGIIQVADLDELLETAVLLAAAPTPGGSKLGVIGISGGEVAMLSDLAEDNGLEFADLAEETATRIRSLLPPFSKVGNPLDAWGIGDLGNAYANCLEALGQDPSVDLVAVCQDAQIGLTERSIAYYVPLAHSVVGVSKRLHKPLVLFSNISGGVHPSLREILEAGGVPTLQGTTPSLRAIRHFVDYGAYRRLPRRLSASSIAPHESRIPGAFGIQPGSSLGEHASKQLLSAYGIRSTREEIAGSLREAKRIALKLGYPIVLKVDSPDIQHKTDAGAVRLNVRDAEELARAYEEVLANARKACPAARVGGVLVQEMLDLSQALETIVGVTWDPQFGPTVLFGLGGVLVEVLRDFSLRVAPLTEEDAWSMLDDIRCRRVLDGVRGKPPADRGAIVDVLIKVSALAIELEGRLAEVDINPLVVFSEGKGAVAADALVVASGGE
jgi:acyl-CoA synthetase (NDP forming)